MNIIILATLVLLIAGNSGYCAKILAVFPAPGRSHYILGSALLKALAEKGHDVTMISCFGENAPPKNVSYRDIVATGVLDQLKEMQQKQKTTLFDREGQNFFMTSFVLSKIMTNLVEATLKHENVQRLINSDEKFDVVITEQFVNDAHKALSTHFGAPLILLSTVGANYWINSLVGNPEPLSYIPNVMTDFTVPLSFFKKLINVALYIFNELYFNLSVFPKQNELIKKYIPNGPEIYDVLYNSSIVLLNSHSSISQPVPYVPNMIEIGGFHIKPPHKLPQDLQEFLDNAKDGAIYFSMGSNLKSTDFPAEKRDAILKTFAKLKQKVLWKWEEDVLPGQPKNVKLAKWLPQQDILAHPNVKLFITHGGFLSTIETIYHGVPILTIPIFGDQKLNAKNAVNDGYGVMLPYKEISEEKLTQSLTEVLNDPRYSNNARKKSEVFHDRLTAPMETAIYWVEYVIRHKGAPHLRVAGLDLPWYKYHLVDVISFFILLVIISAISSYYFAKMICRKLCAKLKNKSKKTQESKSKKMKRA